MNTMWVSGARQFLQRFDTSFEVKMMVKIYAIEVIFKSHEPFHSYKLAGLANSATFLTYNISAIAYRWCDRPKYTLSQTC